MSKIGALFVKELFEIIKKDITELTYSVYKLNLQQSYLLYKNGKQYNPYFTRFFEDIHFNLLNNCIKYNKYYLRFGHLPETNIKNQEDYNDYFKSYILQSSVRIPYSQPVYMMYFHFFYVCRDILELTFEKKNKHFIFHLAYNDKKPEINPFSTNKYSTYAFILYKLLAIFYKKNIKFILNNTKFSDYYNIFDDEYNIFINNNMSIADLNIKLDTYITNCTELYENEKNNLQKFPELKLKYLKYKLKYLELKTKLKNMNI